MFNPLPQLESWVLTDFNCPPSWISSDSVTLVIDHHADQGGVLGRAKLIIEKVASCCTLVAREFYPLLCPIAKKLLLAVITLDSQNGLGTALDLEIASKLAADLGLTMEEGVNLGTKIRNARDAPEFWLRLSPTQILCMDFKKFGNLAMSTIRVTLTACNLSAVMESVLNRMDGLKVFAVMTAAPGQGRELLVYCADDAVLDRLEEEVDKLDGYPHLSVSKGWRCFIINNMKVTRKVVAPMIQALLK